MKPHRYSRTVFREQESWSVANTLITNNQLVISNSISLITSWRLQGEATGGSCMD